MNNKNNASNPSVSCDVLESHIDAFIAELKTAGYATKTLNDKRPVLRHFINWQRCQRHQTAHFHESDILDFLRRFPQHGTDRRRLESAAMASFLKYLRRHSVIQTFTPKPANTVSAILERRYADFLRDDKGLAELSLKVYLPVAKELLLYLKEEHGIRSVRRLDASLLRAFLFEHARARSSECVRLLATSLRSFLRFLHANDEIPNDLTAAIPPVRRWTQPDIPKKLTPAEVKQVLKAPDLETATGRRDHAILLLLARLGLRSSEILSIELGDLRWRTGEIVIRGKGNRQDLLPLPRDVGTAIACYLRRDRGTRPTRRVFLRTIAPRMPMGGPASIGHIVRRAMAKAGVERPMHIAAHLFRHTLASHMLLHGANLREISEVLRHQAQTSTEIYAKIDLGALKEVVRPWPAQGGVR